MAENSCIKNIEIGKFYFIHDDMKIVEEISKREPQLSRSLRPRKRK